MRAKQKQQLNQTQIKITKSGQATERQPIKITTADPEPNNNNNPGSLSTNCFALSRKHKAISALPSSDHPDHTFQLKSL
jgi:hypothetical protein